MYKKSTSISILEVRQRVLDLFSSVSFFHSNKNYKFTIAATADTVATRKCLVDRVEVLGPATVIDAKFKMHFVCLRLIPRVSYFAFSVLYSVSLKIPPIKQHVNRFIGSYFLLVFG